MKRVLALVLGYGCQPGRPEIEDYHRAVVSACEKINGEVTIITCGGYTDPIKYPGFSEAQLGRGLISKFGFKGRSLAEDRSWTTFENLFFAEALVRLLMSKERFQFDRIIIFCDQLRRIRIRFLGKRIFAIYGRPITVSGYVFSRTLKEKLTEYLASLPKTVAGWYFPVFERAATARRIHEWGLISQPG